MQNDKKTGGFKSLGEFLVAVRKFCDGTYRDNRLVGEKTAGHMETADDTQGGFLVPEQWAAEIYNAALEESIVRSHVAPGAIIPATTDSVKVRRLVETTRASSLFGGVTFQWTAERGDKTAAKSNPKIGELELTPHKLVGGFWASNELEADYDRFGSFMSFAFGQAIAFEEDDVFLWGTGAGQPLGAISAGNGSLISIARAAVGALDWADVANMAQRLLPRSWASAVWLVNPDTLSQLFDTTDASLLDMSARTLFGIPFIVTEKAQAMGTQGDIALCDFGHGHYVIADREMRIAASREVPGSTGFVTDETFWKIVLRVDGQPLMTSAITPYRGANSLSAFVVLTTSS